MKICTDIQQSQMLIDLGIDPSTSDMHWTRIDQTFVPEVNLIEGYKNDDDIPAWSLTALLMMLTECKNGFSLIGTTYGIFSVEQGDQTTFYMDEPVDAAYHLIVNSKIKNIND